MSWRHLANDGGPPRAALRRPSPSSIDVPIWPSGIARFADGILEVTTGEGVRVAAADVVEIGVEPPRVGRLSLRLAYRAGLNTVRTSYWVESDYETALRQLADVVTDAKGDA